MAHAMGVRDGGVGLEGIGGLRWRGVRAHLRLDRPVGRRLVSKAGLRSRR